MSLGADMNGDGSHDSEAVEKAVYDMTGRQARQTSRQRFGRWRVGR